MAAWRGRVGAITSVGPLIVLAVLLGWAAPGLAADTVAQGPHTFLEPLGPIAEDQRAHLIRVLAWTSVALLPVFLLTPIILIRYRRTGRASYRPNWEFNPVLETFIWGVPILIVIVLATQLWKTTHRIDPYNPLPGTPVCVQAVGLDWKWLFLFPDEGIATIGELAVPVGQPVAMELTTDTVMQSFRISALVGQIYAMPGMRTALHFEASEAGETRGENTQYNGDGFPHQRFPVRAISQAEWRDWVATVRSSDLVLTDETYAKIGIQGDLAATRTALGTSTEGPIYFSVPDPDLFGRIIARYHTGAAVAPAQQPGTTVYDPALAALPKDPMVMHGAGAVGCGTTGHSEHG